MNRLLPAVLPGDLQLDSQDAIGSCFPTGDPEATVVPRPAPLPPQPSPLLNHVQRRMALPAAAAWRLLPIRAESLLHGYNGAHGPHGVRNSRSTLEAAVVVTGVNQGETTKHA